MTLQKIKQIKPQKPIKPKKSVKPQSAVNFTLGRAGVREDEESEVTK